MRETTTENTMIKYARKGIVALFLTGLFALETSSQPSRVAPQTSIIPKPTKLAMSKGFFAIDAQTRILAEPGTGKELAVCEALAAKLRQVTGYPFPVNQGGIRAIKNSISLDLNPSLGKIGKEGYRLSVTKNSVKIEASEAAGLFYGVQTLYQLLPPEIEGEKAAAGISWSIPCVKIEDQPRFVWRGVHLDVGRHFFSKDFIKKYIDLLAMYKMNTFHWHLTEDQGWRIEIKKYPKLTEVGAWRRESMDDGKPHGGFYTQEDVREIIAYAQERFVTVVPEIEMPGHCQAALASYPELSCSGGPFKVGTEWGIIYDVYCVGNEKTFEFLEDVLTEVTDLFPGEYIHIGGDEVPKLRWQNCAKCQERLKIEGLQNEEELQSYFIKRIEKFLNSKGKRLIGWDEILEGGVAPGATVMSWRGIAGGIEAAKSGHDVVMTPTSHCYFDYYQGRFDEPKAIGGFLPLEKVYAYEPVPTELSPAEAKHILGAQANIWTEYMPNSKQVEYMLLPRMCALSEVVWSKKELRDFQDFSGRIIAHYSRLSAKEVNFRLPPPEGLGGKKIILEPTTAQIRLPYLGAIIRFTLDGTDPGPDSPLYTQPIEIGESAMLKACTFLPNGRKSRVSRLAVSLVNREMNGLKYAFYEGDWFRLPDLTALSPTRTGQVLDISLELIEFKADHFALDLSGYLSIEQGGEYTFYLVTDDGGSLTIGDQEVVRNDGLFGIKESCGKITLQPGRYPIRTTYFQRSGGRLLEVHFEGSGYERQFLPPHWLFLK